MSSYIGAPEDERYYWDDKEPEEDRVEKYGLKLDFYDGQRMDMWVYDGDSRLELTHEEILDARREYSQRNPKGMYAIYPLPSEEATVQGNDPRLCRNCEGTGIAGRVSREMAADAGDAQLEGEAVKCWFCDGTGQFERDRQERKERMQRLGITEEDIEETRYPTCWPENR